MSVRKYLAFSKVIEKGSVTAAAADLGISQSGLTQLLNSLENELDLDLLVRSRSGIRLTEEGEQLLPLMQEVIDADTRVLAHAASLRRTEEEPAGQIIRIGSFTSVAVNWLPEIIYKYSKEEPDVRIELIDGGYNNIEKTFKEHPIDFGFVRLPLDFKCKTLPLFNDRLLAVLPESFDTSKLIPGDQPGSFICPTSLFETEPVISLIDTVDRDAKTIFRSAGIVPNIRYRVEDDFAMLAMVEKGLGIAITPELMLKNSNRNVRIAQLQPAAFRMIGIAFPDYAHISEAAIKFVDYTKKFLN